MAKLSAALSAILPAALSAALWEPLLDADRMLAAGESYTRTTPELKGNIAMIIIYGLDIWTALSPLLTPWWQQGVTSVRRILKGVGASI
jgi:hypothetical protein